MNRAVASIDVEKYRQRAASPEASLLARQGMFNVMSDAMKGRTLTPWPQYLTVEHSYDA